MRLLPVALVAVGLAAQASPAQQIPRRPKLPADLDTNDARDYYAWAARRDVNWRQAHDAYYWAWRLEPDVTDFLFARYQALWFRQTPQWRSEYRKGAAYVRKSKDSKLLDSLYGEILKRNPFPHLDGPCLWPDGIEDVRDPLLAGYVFLDFGCFQHAAEKLAEAIAKKPDELIVRLDRAHALYVVREYRAAAAELHTVLDSLRARDETRLGPVYNSKEMLEYMVGMAALQRDDLAGARAALGRALTENLAFYPAHDALARVAMHEGNTAGAISEAELAVGLKGDDGVLRLNYGTFLLRAGQYAEAEAQLAKAVELEPYWAEAYRSLATALDRQGKTAQAIDQYRNYVSRAPKRMHVRAKQCADRIAELAGGGSPAGL